MKIHLLLIIASLILFTNCRRLPSERLYQFTSQVIQYEVDADSLKIKIDNSLYCPLRIMNVTSADQSIQEKIGKSLPLIADAQSNILFTYQTTKSKDELKLEFSATLGNPNDSIHKKDISLPFSKDGVYRIIQGYNSKYSHNSEYSKYAIDFNLAEGDTVCVAADGYVVGVIVGYTRGGKTKRWADYANFITVFHPDMNLFTQYVHLMHEGSFVEVGDFVKAEQPIGLSGKTGYTDIEHLHFNVIKSNSTSMQSTPINFVGGYRGADLKMDDWVTN